MKPKNRVYILDDEDLVVTMLLESAAAFEFVRRATDEDWVYHLDFGSADAALRAIAAVLLDVGPALQQLLDVPERAVVYTSAKPCQTWDKVLLVAWN